MNKYGEFNSKRFLILLLLICLIFFVVILKAFEYLPDSSNDGAVKRNTIQNMPMQDKSIEENNIEDAAEKKSTEDNQVKEEKKGLNITLPKPAESEELESIDELPKEAVTENSANIETPVQSKAAELTPEEKAQQIFFEAERYKKNKQYVKALEEYQKITSITNDVDTVAKSYEEIATIYAIVKRYGTALSYAQKAYNMSPSSSREMLLARLYYKTGDIDKATRRINNVLQRDFSADR